VQGLARSQTFRPINGPFLAPALLKLLLTIQPLKFNYKKTMFKFFTKITGDDYNMLINDTPASRKKVVLLANALFVPVLLWFFSVYSMATNLFGASIIGGIFAGLTAATFIFLIDRSILMANGNRLIAGFRIVMGLCIATIGSIMVDEFIFHDDINQQFESNKEAAIKVAKDNISKSYNYSEANAASAMAEKAVIWNNGLEDAKREADGKGGSKTRGVGKITEIKLQLAESQKTDYYQSKAENDSILSEKAVALKKAEDKINSSYGNAMLLHRIEALFDLVFSNKVVAVIYIIFTIFIWCLEFIVILFKMNSAETNYERKIRMIEQIGANRIDKITSKDLNWFEGDMNQTVSKNLRNEIRKNPPAFYN
jgi:hypothetical protein